MKSGLEATSAAASAARLEMLFELDALKSATAVADADLAEGAGAGEAGTGGHTPVARFGGTAAGVLASAIEVIDASLAKLGISGSPAWSCSGATLSLSNPPAARADEDAEAARDDEPVAEAARVACVRQ